MASTCLRASASSLSTARRISSCFSSSSLYPSVGSSFILKATRSWVRRSWSRSSCDSKRDIPSLIEVNCVLNELSLTANCCRLSRLLCACSRTLSSCPRKVSRWPVNCSRVLVSASIFSIDCCKMTRAEDRLSFSTWVCWATSVSSFSARSLRALYCSSWTSKPLNLERNSA